MISIPVTLGTRADYDRALDKARKGEQPALDVLPHFIGLRDNRFAYVFDKSLNEQQEPDGETPDYIVLTDSETEQRTQLKRVEMSNAAIFTLGYTVAAVKKIIKELEALQ